jgi:MYXO-CTERM domain-containing protein
MALRPPLSVFTPLSRHFWANMQKPNKPMKPKLTLSLLSLLFAGGLHAQTVDWGTSVALNSNGPGGATTTQSFLSDGSDMPASMTWDLGYFSGGFVPNQTNFSMWNDNWVSLQTAFLQPSPDFNLSGHINDVGAAAANQQGYIWAYSDRAAMGVAGTEALLVTASDWIMPTVPNQITFDIADFTGSPDDDNMTVVWGRVDRIIEGAGGVLQGGGIITDPQADSNSPDYSAVTFEVQTATWATPVPEPSSALVALLGIFGLFGRRKRG